MSREKGRLDYVHISHFVNPSILSHSAVDAGTPGGTEPVGVWMDGRGRLPDILIPFLYPSSDKTAQCSHDHSVLIPSVPPALEHTQTWTLTVEQIQRKYFFNRQTF